MIIDFHAHCFPARIAEAALDKLSRSSGALKPCTDGTPEGLRLHMAECGVDIAVVLHIATSPAQQRAVNDFAAAINGAGIRSFGSVHPQAPGAFEELERIAALGLKGVKFHPQYQGFAADDAKMLPLYRKIASLGLVTSFHAGLDLGFLDCDLASPRRIARALHAFDGAPVVAAHMGGAMIWKEASKCLAGLPVYFDTSFSHGHIPLPEALALVEKHGIDRLLFGSDAPWSGMDGELAFVHSLELSEADTRKILYANAAGLLGIA